MKLGRADVWNGMEVRGMRVTITQEEVRFEAVLRIAESKKKCLHVFCDITKNC